jgi:hypothetical protein
MRFIDDIFVATDDSTSPHTWLYRGINSDGIYPTKLMGANGKIILNPLQLTGVVGKSVNFLDIKVSISKGQFKFELFDERDGLIVNGEKLSKRPNFPYIDSLLSSNCKSGVITSQLYRFSRRTSVAKNFRKTAIMFLCKMKKHGYS